MLVLTRKLQEKIRIGNEIIITVLRTKGKQVRLGIEAPADVPVIRGELAFDSGDRELTHATTGAITVAATGAMTVDDTRPEPDSSRNHGNWPSDSRSERAAAAPPGVRPAQVHFERVPRRQLAGLLPQAPAAAGPLRAMLDRRSAAT